MIRYIKYILLFLLCLSATIVSAQNKQIDKANKKYSLKKYAEAIPLFEQGLKIDKNLSASTRLAFCYRMINNMDKATELYSAIVSKKRARPITWLYYGETLMSQGKYEESKIWFEKYTEAKAGDPQGWKMLNQLESIKNITPYFQNIKVEKFTHNSEADDSGPMKYNNGIVFSSDRKQGIKLLKQRSGWTGRDFINIYFSELKEDGTYSNPKSFSKKVNQTNKNSGNPTFSPDGTTMVFSRNSDWATKRGDYNLMLFMAKRSDNGKWKNIEMMSFCNLNANYMHPTFSVTGDTIFFVSDKSGSVGGTDIFYSYKKGSKWVKPKNLSEEVNTESNEGYPFMDASGKLFFCSKGHAGYGGFDIFFTKKNEKGNWETPVNVGFPINSSHDDISIFVEKNGTAGMFASSRESDDDNIYFFKTVDPTREMPTEIEALIVEEKSEDSDQKSEESIVATTPEIEEKMDIEIQEEKTPTTYLQNNKTEISDIVPMPEEEDDIDAMAMMVEEMMDIEDDSTVEISVIESSTKGSDIYDNINTYINEKIPAKGTVFILENIKFDPYEFMLTPEIADELTPLVEFMQQHPDLHLEIGSHTESLGDDRKNMIFSIKRATAIAGHLIRHGISTDRLKIRGYGETKLLNRCSNEVTCSQEEHFENHRIEVKIIN